VVEFKIKKIIMLFHFFYIFAMREKNLRNIYAIIDGDLNKKFEMEK